MIWETIKDEFTENYTRTITIQKIKPGIIKKIIEGPVSITVPENTSQEKIEAKLKREINTMRARKEMKTFNPSMLNDF